MMESSMPISQYRSAMCVIAQEEKVVSMLRMQSQCHRKQCCWTVQRKKRTHVEQVRDPAKKADPRTFVFWRGKHGVRALCLLLQYQTVLVPRITGGAQC